MASTSNPYGNYTVGQAPGLNQVNLPAMTSNMNDLLASGSLGNNVANPMTPIIADEGQYGLGYQNAMANSRMGQIGLQSAEDALKQSETNYENQQQQPGLTDILSLLGSGASAVNAINQRDTLNNLLNSISGSSNSLSGNGDTGDLINDYLSNTGSYSSNNGNLINNYLNNIGGL